MNQQALVYRTLRRIPAWEINRFAEVVADALAGSLSEDGPTIRSDNRKQGLSESTQAKIARSKVIPKSRRAPGTHARKVA